MNESSLRGSANDGVQAAWLAILTTVIAAGAMLAGASRADLTCPTFTAGSSCSKSYINPCAGGACLAATVKAYCTDLDGKQQLLWSQKVTNPTSPWFRCFQNNGPGSPSCAENVQVCGATQNYTMPYNSTGFQCVPQLACAGSYTRSACGSFRSDPCSTNTGGGGGN